MLDRAGVAPERRRFERSIDARYERQSYELSIPVPARAIDQAALSEIAEAFHDRHRADLRPRQSQRAGAARQRPRRAPSATIPPLPIRDKTAPAGTDAVKIAARRCGFAQPALSTPRSTIAAACRPGSWRRDRP